MSSSSTNDAGSSNLKEVNDPPRPATTEQPLSTKQTKYTKVHTVTVCMLPPPTDDNEKVWETLSAMRRQVKDPGYYRWPPHVNLLYPFLKLPRHDRRGAGAGDEDGSDDDSTMSLPDIVDALKSATQQIPAFSVRLHTFGTFGGKQRGVLWLHPDSEIDDNIDSASELPPLIQLQQNLEAAFPMCNDQSKKGGKFVPHMTISHFASNDDALEAQKELEASFPNRDDLAFLLDRIYLLERKGDDGQFLKVAEIALGATPTDSIASNNSITSQNKESKAETKIFDPPQPFSPMPTIEEDWVYTARTEMKARRNKNQRRRRKGDSARIQGSTPKDAIR